MDIMDQKLVYQRPISVMSYLADQMQSSCLNDREEEEFQENFPFSEDPYHDNKLISSSAPTNNNILIPHVEDLVKSTYFCSIENECESCCSSPINIVPPKRKCHSVSDQLRKPIAIKPTVTPNVYNNCQLRRSSFSYSKIIPVNSSISIAQNNNNNNRTIISPHYKKSAFTPTVCNQPSQTNQSKSCMSHVASRTSPSVKSHLNDNSPNMHKRNGNNSSSSDYSVSPPDNINIISTSGDISPVHRSASITSSGFHDLSQQSLVFNNYSPDNIQCQTTSILPHSAKESQRQPSNTTTTTRCRSHPTEDGTINIIRQNRSGQVCNASSSCLTNASSVLQHHHQNHHSTSRSLQHNHYHHRQSSTVHTDNPSSIQRHVANTSRCKRRYPSSITIPDYNRSSSNYTSCCTCSGHYSAENSPSTCINSNQYQVRGKIEHFFNASSSNSFITCSSGNNRNYLCSLPRIISSPLNETITGNECNTNFCDELDQQIDGKDNDTSTSSSEYRDINDPPLLTNQLDFDDDDDDDDDDQNTNHLDYDTIRRYCHGNNNSSGVAMTPPSPVSAIVMGTIADDSSMISNNDTLSESPHKEYSSFQPMDINQIELD